MEQIIRYIRSSRQRYISELFDLLRIPSVSNTPAHAGDVARCAQALADHLKAIGMATVEVLPTAGHPVVYADWLNAPGAPTILVYGHYDVQPTDPLEQWQSPPFEPEIRQGEIYARGAADDKGQIFAHIKAIEAYLRQTGSLPVNLKLLFEGEEEISSMHFTSFVAEHKAKLQADVIIISDTSMFALGVPTICYGTRGMAGLQIDLQGTARDLHSGDFGGMVANPIQALATLLAALKDENGRVTIPGFYDDVLPLQPQERRQFQALGFDETAMQQAIESPALFGETGFTALERRWARPTLDVNGMLGGYTGEGMKTIIPAKAMAKITMRLVPNQTPDTILRLTKTYLQNLTPPTMRMSFSEEFGTKPYLTPLDHPVLSFIAAALRNVYQRDPVFIRSGGTIGVLETFADALHIPTVFVGLSQPNDNAHAPNEHLNEECFYTGIETVAWLYHELNQWKPR